ncbi:hypothetical protein TREMEDRAFT_26852 [Tremella mesenterica DSM 1558]|uniref:uncharacterized protein n=1 Tax=Tremella mesenterica (strain ATCC 24925 / CBS 8224 / DSM 1558 / NBRC 9311 / NRRL Y-6157 / RJB 2259-6 / UBC 559-6) TaxID=578456 RepID=UPI0003F4A2D1|nr:uncharacterized protein TREMEDRAFT_26852 [Tremella mesenterica DSM 1558]EIW73104.1 hypothetical protein TREMEDRAFT_26852 [Tremella mesenterica DSM 1558]
MAHQNSLENHKSKTYETHASFVYSVQNTSPVLSLLNAQPGERIIDLGCGTGHLTELIKDQVGEGEVIGVDSSTSMLEKARSKLSKITYIQADIQSLPTTLDPSYKGTFDAVFTSATLHWCKDDPLGVLKSVEWLLKPGGRMAVGVRASIHRVLRNKNIDPVPLDPWYFPTVQQYTDLISQTCLKPTQIALHPRPTALNTDIIGWLETFVRNTFFISLSESEAVKLMEEIQEDCRVDCYWSSSSPGIGIKSDQEKGEKKEGWEIMYVRLRGLLVKP